MRPGALPSPLCLVLIPLALQACAEGPAASGVPTLDADAHAIIRGEPVEEGVYPWMIDANGCSASLISPSYVLMAAHCFGGTRNEQGTLEGVTITSRPVRFGHPDRTSPRVTRHEVAEVHLHPDYIPLTVEETWGLEPYDVALLELAEPILLEDYLRLPTRDPIAGEGVIAAGWGLTEEGRAATVLQQAVLIVADDADCYVGDEIRFCTLGNEDRSNIGAGDSGGPVFVPDGDGFMVLGTNSTANGDAPSPLAMHAQTRAFVPWILDVAGDEFACTGEGEDEVCKADIDECALGLDACGDHGRCENTVEAWTCDCDPGFRFDGEACVEDAEPETEPEPPGGCVVAAAGPSSVGGLAGLVVLGVLGRRRRSGGAGQPRRQPRNQGRPADVAVDGPSDGRAGWMILEPGRSTRLWRTPRCCTGCSTDDAGDRSARLRAPHTPIPWPSDGVWPVVSRAVLTKRTHTLFLSPMLPLYLVASTLTASAADDVFTRPRPEWPSCAAGFADGQSLVIGAPDGLSRLAFPSGEALWHVPGRFVACKITLDEPGGELVVAPGDGTLRTYGLDGTPRVQAHGLPTGPVGQLVREPQTWKVFAGQGVKASYYWLWPDGELREVPRSIAFVFGERPEAPAAEEVGESHDWAVYKQQHQLWVTGPDGGRYLRSPALSQQVEPSWGSDGSLQLRSRGRDGCEIIRDPVTPGWGVRYPFIFVGLPGEPGADSPESCPKRPDSQVHARGLTARRTRKGYRVSSPDDPKPVEITMAAAVRGLTWLQDGQRLLVITDDHLLVHDPQQRRHPGMVASSLRRRPADDPRSVTSGRAQTLPWGASRVQGWPVVDVSGTRWPVLGRSSLFLGGDAERAWLYQRTVERDTIGGWIGGPPAEEEAMETPNIGMLPTSLDAHTRSYGAGPPRSVVYRMLKVSGGGPGGLQADPPDPVIVMEVRLGADGATTTRVVERVVVHGAEAPRYLGIRLRNETDQAVFGVGPTVVALPDGLWAGTSTVADVPAGGTVDVPFMLAHAGARSSNTTLELAVFADDTNLGSIRVPVAIEAPRLRLVQVRRGEDSVEVELDRPVHGRLYGRDQDGRWHAGPDRVIPQGTLVQLGLPPAEARLELMLMVTDEDVWEHQWRVP